MFGLAFADVFGHMLDFSDEEDVEMPAGGDFS